MGVSGVVNTEFCLINCVSWHIAEISVIMFGADKPTLNLTKPEPFTGDSSSAELARYLSNDNAFYNVIKALLII